MRIRKIQEFRVGRQLDTPFFTRPSVLIAEVAEDENGEIAGAFFLEAEPAISIIANSPRVLASLEKHAPEVLQRLQECGFRFVQVSVPKAVGAKERKAMMKAAERIGKKSGMKFTRHPKSHGFFDLRGA